MDAKSTITYPSSQHPLRESGFVEIRGLAWSGRGTIVRVEVSTDGGHNWALAELQQPVLPKALTVFRFPWQWHGEETILQSRCTDSTGYVQPTRAALLQARGAASFYLYNAITAWLLHQNHIIAADAAMNAETLPQVQMPNRDGFIGADVR